MLEGCRAHRLSEDQAAELLGLNHYELDGFLERHAVFLDYSIEDDERETRNRCTPLAEAPSRTRCQGRFTEINDCSCGLVADASPLRYLGLIEEAEILPGLYGGVLIPPAV